MLELRRGGRLCEGTAAGACWTADWHLTSSRVEESVHTLSLHFGFLMLYKLVCFKHTDDFRKVRLDAVSDTVDPTSSKVTPSEMWR